MAVKVDEIKENMPCEKQQELNDNANVFSSDACANPTKQYSRESFKDCRKCPFSLVIVVSIPWLVVTGWRSNMHSLVVQALAMRQLGRLNPRHLLAAGYGPAQTEWCPRTIHTRQVWGCSTYPTLGCHRPALCGRDAVRRWTIHQLRFKSNRKKGASKPTHQEEEEEEEEKDPESSDSEDEADEVPNLPKDYKDVEKYVQSFRYDVLLRAGLDMARNKIEDSFYSNKLRLNGQRLIKKSKTVKVGDTLDLVISENQDTNTVTLMRVVLKKVLGESSNAEKYKVSLRRWKIIAVPKDEAFKP